MKYMQEYRSKLMAAEHAATYVKSGDLVEYGQAGIKPVDFDKALAARKGEPGLKHVLVRTTNAIPPVPQVAYNDPEQSTFLYYSGFWGMIDRMLAQRGNIAFIPANYHQVPSMLQKKSEFTPDIWCGQVSPMDKNGFFSFGITNSHNWTYGNAARKRFVEVVQDMPRALGGYNEGFHISEIDGIIESDNKVMCLPTSSEGSPVVKQIAELIMDDIHDGCCLQLGIGAVPNEIGNMIAQSGLRDLSIHSELFCDSMVKMYQNGQITNRRKIFDKGKTAYTFAFGSRECYDFLDNNHQLASYPVDYVNDPTRIASIDNMITINNILEVDLFSQVCSESIGAQQFSGTGGQVDFITGGIKSNGGRAYLAFTSTYKDKEGKLQSRIKKFLTPGSMVTVPRPIIPIMVTEYGKADLFAASTWKRAESLINLAHPDFREDLIKDAEELKIWRRSSRF